jgi:hypothetical protein
MASTIDTGFQMLSDHLEITDDQRLAILRHQGEIERALSKGFETHGTEFTGAYSRNTMIAPAKGAVVDLFLLLRFSYGRSNTAEDLLEKLQETLIKLSEEASISASGHGVVIPLSDYRFNVVPSFHKENKGYVIPDYKKDQWITTNPKTYSDQLKKDNKWHEGHLLPVIRIIKCWNQVIDNVFDDYYLELLVRKVFTDVPITTYASSVRHFFKEATKEVVFTIDDPAGFGDQVQGLHEPDRLPEAMICFHEAYKTTLKAEEHENEGELGLAFHEWGSIFTGYFPKPLEMLIQELENSGIEGVEALKIIRDRKP